MEALVKAGVDTVILAVSYLPELLEKEMKIHAEKLGERYFSGCSSKSSRSFQCFVFANLWYNALKNPKGSVKQFT